MNRCPLCETMPPHHDRDCPAGYVERLHLFTPSSLLMRRLLLLAADNSQDWLKVKETYRNHSGETLAELLYFAAMVVNISTVIHRAITAAMTEQSRMQSSTIGKSMPDQRAVPSSLSPEGSNGAQAASTVTKSRAQLFSELTGPIDPSARIKAAEDLGMPLVAAYLRGRLLEPKKHQSPSCSETLEIAKQAAQHRQQGG